MRKLGRQWVAAVAGVAVLALMHAPAMGASILDFNITANQMPPMGGSISYAGGVAPLVGSNIQVATVELAGSPGTQVACVGCVLNFTTGDLSSSTTLPGPVHVWIFGGGPTSSISIAGAVPAAGIAAPVTLLTGSFGTATVTQIGANTFKIAGASFTDTKDDNLLNFFGLPTGVPYSGSFNISFEGPARTAGQSFASTQVLSGDVANQPQVPEPGTLLLLGSGLVGFAYLARRRRKQTA